MRILFVGDPYCVHTARWIAQLRETSWDLHIFDPANRLVHEELEGVHLHTGWKKPFVPRDTRISYRWPFLRGRHFMARKLPALWRRVLPEPGRRLAALIRRLRPDCIHSLGLQQNSDVLLEAKTLLQGDLGAPWIYTSRGSDIFFYRKFPEHQKEIRGVLEACDYYICNCERDVRLAEDYGFRGEHLGLFQGGGGFPIEQMRKDSRPGNPSARRVIAVKGLETQFGRALLTIDALGRCASQLQGYTLKFYQAQAVARKAALALAEEKGLAVEIVPRVHYTRIWALFGEARLSIGISRSDGVANTLIEAMIMGAFPIQTDPGGASAEWVENGVNGLLVPDDDPQAIATALRRALADDALVDTAAVRNPEIAAERIDAARVRPRVLDLYRRVAA